MKRLSLFTLLLLPGCATVQGNYTVGETAIAQHFSNYPQYNGELVTVKEGFKWQRIKGTVYMGNALRVYRIETSDGRELAAQDYQLTKVKP